MKEKLSAITRKYKVLFIMTKRCKRHYAQIQYYEISDDGSVLRVCIKRDFQLLPHHI